MYNYSNEEYLLYKLAKDYIFESHRERFDYEKIKWDKVLQLFKLHKSNFLLDVVENEIPDKYKANVAMQRCMKHAQIDVQLQEYTYIQKAFQKKEIDIIWMKGIPFGQIIYGDMYIRDTNDMDFLIEKEKIPQAYYTLRELGYAQEMGLDETTGRWHSFDSAEFKYVGDYHELCCFKEVADRVYLFVELKKATSGVDERRIDSFFRNTMYVDIKKNRVKTSDYEHIFIHLCANAYGNCEYYGCRPVLRDFIDICIFYKKYRKKLNWRKVLDICRKSHLSYMVAWIMEQTNILWDEEFFQQSIIEQFPQNDFFPEDEAYDFFSPYGSMNYWQTSIRDRIFDLKLHRKEQVNSYKRRLYSETLKAKKDCLEVFAESKKNLPTYEFNIIRDNWKLVYTIFLKSNNKLCISLNVDDEFITKMDKKRIEFVFTDNNLDNGIRENSVILYSTDNGDFVVHSESIRIEECSGMNKITGKIEILFDLSELDMDWQISNGYMVFNIVSSRVIAEYAYTDLVYLSGNSIPMYLHFPNTFEL